LNNSTIELLQRRRSAPPATMAGRAPSAEERELMLTLASRVPDHGKIVPFRFILFEGEAQQKAGDIIAKVYAKEHPNAKDSELEKERRRLTMAPLVIAVVSRTVPEHKVPEWEQVLCAGAVCFNLLVAANALGFASIWLTEWHSYDRAVLKRFGVDKDERIAGYIHIGHDSGPREDRARPKLADIVTTFEG
jgi:nitroreductase